MRAREFITEERNLPIEIREPMAWAYEIPDLDTANPYRVYRFGVAIARARSDAEPNTVNPYQEEWSEHTAAGEAAMVVGMNPSVDPIIDQAMRMAGVAGSKKALSTPGSREPEFVDKISPVKPFRGYPR